MQPCNLQCNVAAILQCKALAGCRRELRAVPSETRALLFVAALAVRHADCIVQGQGTQMLPDATALLIGGDDTVRDVIRFEKK